VQAIALLSNVRTVIELERNRLVFVTSRCSDSLKCFFLLLSLWLALAVTWKIDAPSLSNATIEELQSGLKKGTKHN
jgi:hypothetical protein